MGHSKHNKTPETCTVSTSRRLRTEASFPQSQAGRFCKTGVTPSYLPSAGADRAPLGQGLLLPILGLLTGYGCLVFTLYKQGLF